jgi:hypothetical protein
MRSTGASVSPAIALFRRDVTVFAWRAKSSPRRK